MSDTPLDFDTVTAIGLDGTGRDGDPRFPYTEASLTPVETLRLRNYRESGSVGDESTSESPTPPVFVFIDNMDGAAFVGDQAEDDERDDTISRGEVARLLREAAGKIEGGAGDGVLYDINGAKAGRFAYNPPA